MKPTRYKDLDEALNDYTEWYIYNEDRVTALEHCVKFLRSAIDGYVYLFHLMRDRIHMLRDAYTNTSDLDAALERFTVWYTSNRDTVVDVLPLLEFLKKATDDSLHLLHLMREQIAHLTVKEQEPTMILMPTGVRL